MSGTRKRLSPRVRRQQELYDENMRRRALERPARALAHSGDVETSKQAAADSADRKSSHRRVALLLHASHRSGGGLSDGEVSARSGGVLDLIEARRRCSDLRALGLIEWRIGGNGKPVLGQTKAGKACRVSVITPRGLAALAGGEEKQA